MPCDRTANREGGGLLGADGIAQDAETVDGYLDYVAVDHGTDGRPGSR